MRSPIRRSTLPPVLLRLWTALAAIGALACGAPAGRPATDDHARTAPARVSVESETVTVGESDVPSGPVVAWPTDSGLDGADAERVRISVDGRPGRGAGEPLVTIVIFSDF